MLSQKLVAGDYAVAPDCYRFRETWIAGQPDGIVDIKQPLLPARCSNVNLRGTSSRSSQVMSLVLAASKPGTRAALLQASSTNRIGGEMAGVYF